MAFIIGKKIGMTRVFRDDGTVTPVTVLQVDPVIVTQIRSKDKDGYEAVQYGYGKAKHPNKPSTGHMKPSKAQSKYFREAKGMSNSEGAGLAVGDVVAVSALKAGDTVKVTGVTKGRGFQGAVKRHGFHGLPASHGHHHVMRHVGSIGQRFPQHTLKGTRMAGRMGGKRMTTRGLHVVSIDQEKHQLSLRGAVPGRKGTWLAIETI